MRTAADALEAPFDGQIVFTYTDDLEASARFWAETVGLELALDQGACRIFRTGPASFLGVCRLPDRPRAIAGVTITLLTDDVDGWHARLSARGVVFEQAPRAIPEFSVYACLFHDPNGYRVEIQRFEGFALAFA